MDVSLIRFVGYFLWLGAVGFGGPIALAGHMQQDLVDHRRWISKQDYIEGLALAQLAPGPLAAQLAMYLGYVKDGIGQPGEGQALEVGGPPTGESQECASRANLLAAGRAYQCA